MEEGTATTLYRECPHCAGEGFVTVHLPPSSPLLEYLGGETEVVKACPHCLRRCVIAAVAPGTRGRVRLPALVEG